MPMRNISGAFCLAATAVLFAASQGAAAADRSGASAQSKAAGAARAGDASANLASGSSVNAVLKPVDFQRGNPGDPVTARMTQATRTEGDTSIPKGSTLIGHVSEAHAGAEGQTGSSMGIVFDKAVTRDGHEIALRNVGIQVVAAAEASAASRGMPTPCGVRAAVRGRVAAGACSGARAARSERLSDWL